MSEVPKGWDGFDPDAINRDYQPRLDVRSAGAGITCTGCGREFSAYKIPHYSLAWDGTRIKNQNKGRAASHLRACRRKWEQETS